MWDRAEAPGRGGAVSPYRTGPGRQGSTDATSDGCALGVSVSLGVSRCTTEISLVFVLISHKGITQTNGLKLNFTEDGFPKKLCLDARIAHFRSKTDQILCQCLIISSKSGICRCAWMSKYQELHLSTNHEFNPFMGITSPKAFTNK